jgi:hypothetical protein
MRAALADLMRPDDEVEVVAFEEFGDHVGTKREGDAAVVLGPARNVLAEHARRAGLGVSEDKVWVQRW